MLVKLDLKGSRCYAVVKLDLKGSRLVADCGIEVELDFKGSRLSVRLVVKLKLDVRGSRCFCQAGHKREHRGGRDQPACEPEVFVPAVCDWLSVMCAVRSQCSIGSAGSLRAICASSCCL